MQDVPFGFSRLSVDAVGIWMSMMSPNVEKAVIRDSLFTSSLIPPTKMVFLVFAPSSMLVQVSDESRAIPDIAYFLGPDRR